MTTSNDTPVDIGSAVNAGKLYRWEGTKFQKAMFEKTSGQRVPITEKRFKLRSPAAPKGKRR